MNYTILRDSLFYIMVPMIFVALFTPIIKKVAFHINALDVPNGRKVHTKPIPRLGGLAIMSGFLLGYILFGEPDKLMNSILIGSFIVVITGMIDDINPIPAKIKFIFQLLAVIVVVIYGNINMNKLTVLGYLIDFKWLTIPLTILFLLACINCMNFIDGLDGLASGISAIYFLTVGIISLLMSRFGNYYVISLIMLGCTVGFLIHNFHPADIFLGDSGSMLLGYLIGVVALLGYKTVVLTSIVIPLLILAIPLLDVAFAIIRRKLKGESMAKPDKAHIHHQLLRRTSSQKTTVIIIYIIQALFSLAAIVYMLHNTKLGYILYGILMFIVIIFMLTTDVVVDMPAQEKKLFKKFKKKAH
ncbi:MAG: undecaprenyl/decaprenyl-phosphate alpha-N-acetylglucosaminyl 1-phosphate transferase [Bacilli bacterium]|nr:undecaprenyl/decaprenyl-phosphate alpha-N-acetylglucosaminyl 1-phosphate transferase [Bacilli bacterium]